MLTDGKLIENNTLSLNLSNETGDTIMNPSTIDRVVLYVITLIISSSFSIGFYVITKNKKYLGIFILGLLLITFEDYALEKLGLKIDTKIVIEERFHVNYVYGIVIRSDEKDNYELEEGSFCLPTLNQEYEYCFVIYTDPVLYAKGEEVNFKESVESGYINEQGELSTQTIIPDYVNHEVYTIMVNSLEQVGFEEENTFNFWLCSINNDTNNPDDSYLNIFREENVVNHSLSSVDEYVEVKTPGTFKMQNHDMFFYLKFPVR